jgi:hemoglobin
MNATIATTPYDAIGREAAVAEIVNRFYDIMDRDPAYARLRALHAADLAPVRNGLTRFMAGWLGGPRDWFDRGQCVMSIHRAFQIDAALAAQWSEAMSRALAGQDGIAPELQAKLVDAMGHMARAMVSPLAG